MPQLHLPMFPRRDADHGCAGICQAGRSGDVFQRADAGVQSCRGRCRQLSDDHQSVLRPWGAHRKRHHPGVWVTSISVKRSVKIYRQRGPRVLCAALPRVGPAVLLDAVVAQAEERLAEGCSVAEVAAELGVTLNTLQKAIRAGGSAPPLKKAAGDSAGAGRHAEVAKQIARSPRRRAAKASAPKWIARLRWDAGRLRRWNGWRQAWAY